jgi:hypothetical protein
MANTENVTLIQGDTAVFIIPVVDDDDPDETFETLTNYDTEFAISDDTSVLVSGSDVTTKLVEFGTTKVGAESYNGLDTIDGTQTVIKIEVPSSQTETLAVTGDTPLRYQVRVYNSTTNTRVTVLRGQLSVEGSAIEGTA